MRPRGRFAPAALALALMLPVLAGCYREASDAVEADAVRADYQDCRDRAPGADPQALIACADAAIEAAAPGSDAGLSALGDAALAQAGSDALALRVAVADALAGFAIDRATVRAGLPLPPAPQAPVSPALARAAARVVADTCKDSPALAACRAAHDRLLPRLAARLAAIGPSERRNAAPPAVLGGYVAPTCAAVRAVSADAALEQFQTEFPRPLMDEGLVESVALDDGQVRALSAYLACLAARTYYVPDVAESSLTFFASARNGARARAALAELAKGKGADAEAAREFGEQVGDYLAPPAD